MQASTQVAGEKFDFLRAGLQVNPAAQVSQSFNSRANQTSLMAQQAANAAGTASASSATATGKAIEGVAEYLESRNS